MGRVRKMHRQIIVWRCPGCGHEVEQQLMGTMHTASLSCVSCEEGMETIDLEDSSYDYGDDLIAKDGEYTVEHEVPDGNDLLEKFKQEVTDDSDTESGE